MVSLWQNFSEKEYDKVIRKEGVDRCRKWILKGMTFAELQSCGRSWREEISHNAVISVDASKNGQRICEYDRHLSERFVIN